MNSETPESREFMLQMWRDIYRLYITYGSMENKQENWTRLLKAIAALDIQYHHHPLGTKLMIAIYDWIDDRIKAEIKKEPSPSSAGN